MKIPLGALASASLMTCWEDYVEGPASFHASKAGDPADGLQAILLDIVLAACMLHCLNWSKSSWEVSNEIL